MNTVVEGVAFFSFPAVYKQEFKFKLRNNVDQDESVTSQNLMLQDKSKNNLDSKEG